MKVICVKVKNWVIFYSIIFVRCIFLIVNWNCNGIFLLLFINGKECCYRMLILWVFVLCVVYNVIDVIYRFCDCG